MGCIAIISAIVIMAINVDLAELNNGYVNQLIEQAKGDVNIAKIGLGIGVLGMGLSQLLMGWLERRAAKNPEKSTFLLVLTVLSVISGAFSLFNSGLGDMASAMGNIVSFTINVLVLIAVFNIRKTIYE